MASLVRLANLNGHPYSHLDDAKRGERKRKDKKFEAAEVLERLALKGSCVKDGGEAHAMLLVPMRPEQKRLLPLNIHSPRLFAIARRLTLRPSSLMSPLYLSGHEMAMLKRQADRQLALARVASRGLALQYLPQELRDDKEVVLTAVRSKGRALEFAAPRFRADSEVVLEALSAPGGQKALAFVDQELLNDDRIRTAANGVMACKNTQAICEQRETEIMPLMNNVLSEEIMCLLHL